MKASSGWRCTRNLQDTGKDYIYIAYTYNIGEDEEENIDRRTKLVHYTYAAESEKLSGPSDILSDVPAGNDYNAGRLIFGPDGKLYYTMGELGNNQFGNFLNPIRFQECPAPSKWRLKTGASTSVRCCA